ncbi:uncharacterized protein Bfra_009741 [Botrytis fragariae]|uniref:Uncharacterized protein n=1 Tax=Botrytis fragariae TaxID=1964551 RepID=A0A8H6AMU7_9HELO|nr:uncharacterized protein Bfra_009741 [Botrytis fragariae]KAF5870357.1 hypothetical protein Bfra_009741 [Botrytis fragariae]
MSSNRSNERRPRDSHQSSSSRHYRGSGRPHQEPPRQSDQQASSFSSSYHHAVGTSQQQSPQEASQPLSANEIEFNNYMANAARHVPDNFYNSTGNDQWGPLHLYAGLPVLNRPTPSGTEPVALNVGRNHSSCENCQAVPPINFPGAHFRWKYSHLVDNPACRLGMERALANAPVVTQAQGEYLHGQAFADNNDHGQMPPPVPIPAHPSMPSSAAQNTYANTQSRYVSPYPLQQSQQPQQQQQQYTQQPPTIQPVFDQSSYDIYDEEYDNEQLDSAAAADETASGPGWGVEPPVIVPRSAYPSSESRGDRGARRGRRR